MSNKAAASPAGDIHWAIAMPNTLAGLEKGMTGLAAWLERQGTGPEAVNRASLVFEEIVTNVIRYGFSDDRAHLIHAVAELGGDVLILHFDDDGKAFDPTTGPEHAPANSLAEASIGGRGLMLIRKAARRMKYERTKEGRNRLMIALSRQ
ncbi:MAG TPA: ATP-binding protein [Micropepsaceae bacterium]|nr:ATP-binding protein [Micropepsaceae bacterium]